MTRTFGVCWPQYEDDALAEWAYTKALVAFREGGETAQANKLLKQAVKANKHVPAYLLGHKQLPHDLPPYISVGGDDEAASYAVGNRRAWLNTPGAISWLRKTLDVPLPKAPKPRRPSWPELRLALRRCPQERGEVWQVDAMPSPVAGQDKPEEESPWVVVVVGQASQELLGLEVFESAAEARRRVGLPYRRHAEAARSRGAPAGEDRGPAEGISDGLEGQAQADRRRVCALRYSWTPIDQLQQPLAAHWTPKQGRKKRTSSQPRGPALVAAGTGRGLAGRRPPHAGLDHRRGTALSAVGGRGGQPDRRPGAGPPGGAGASARRVVVAAVLQAIRQPAIGEPHRPGMIEVGSAEQREALLPHLDRAGIECVALERLEHLDSAFDSMAQFLGDRDGPPSLLDAPGMEPAQVGSFYAAAAEFYRRKPWQQVPGDTVIKVECDKFQSGPWYAVVMGQSGVQQGLAIYEDLAALQAMIAGDASEEENARSMSVAVDDVQRGVRDPRPRPGRRREARLARGGTGGISDGHSRQSRPCHASAAGLGIGASGGLPADDPRLPYGEERHVGENGGGGVGRADLAACVGGWGVSFQHCPRIARFGKTGHEESGH